METAKAARLEVEVESERRQRELADVLSQFTVSLSSTLESEAIFERLVETLSQSIPVTRATIWLHESDEELKLFTHRGHGDELKERSIDPKSFKIFQRVLDSQRPVVENAIHGEPGLGPAAHRETFQLDRHSHDERPAGGRHRDPGGRRPRPLLRL